MILFTSDTNILSKKPLQVSFVYLLISLFCAFFGSVYEVFSHEVYSYFMIYAFAFPLMGGTLPFLLLGLQSENTLSTSYPMNMTRNLYHSGIATLTVGSIIRGVLDIYGTTNQLTNYYWIVGIILIAISLIQYIKQCICH